MISVILKVKRWRGGCLAGHLLLLVITIYNLQNSHHVFIVLYGFQILWWKWRRNVYYYQPLRSQNFESKMQNEYNVRIL